MKHMTAFLVAFLLVGSAVAGTKTIPKLYTSERLRLPNKTVCPTTSPVPKEGEMCWDKDDNALKVWNGSSYTTVSPLTGGPFAVNNGETFSGANTFTGAVNFTTSAPAMGGAADIDANLVTMDRSGSDRIIRWDEDGDTDGAFEFDFDGVLANSADVSISGTQVLTPLLTVGDGTGNADITITFNDNDIDAVFTWDESAGQFEFDFDGAQNDKNDVTITTTVLSAPQINMGIGTASDIVLTFDNDDADPTIIWDDDADVIAFTDAGFKHAECVSVAVGASVIVDACDVVTFTGDATIIDTINNCGTTRRGRILYIQCGADASVLGDGTGNMQLAGVTTNFTCSTDDVITLICEGSTGDWLELSRSVN